ncbi:Far1 [Hordeum vulgare]|nr:Far1 [Hordeum vulgare]
MTAIVISCGGQPSELTDIMVDMEFGELLKDWIHDWSDDENSDSGDWAENRNVGEDVNMDVDDDIEENNSEVSNENYISQTDLEDELVDAPDSGESHSLVNMSEVTEDEGKENVQDSTHADGSEGYVHEDKRNDFGVCRSYDGEGDVIAVQDPMKVSSKGATKLDEKHPVSKNGRPLSYDEIKIQCRACKFLGHTKCNKNCKLHNKIVGQEEE